MTVHTFDGYRLAVGNERGNLISASEAMDVSFGRAGADVLSGGGGDDDLVGGDGRDLVRGGSGMDHLDGGPGDDLLFGGQENDRLGGGAGADWLLEGAGHGDLDGGGGDDHLFGGRGADAFVVDPTSGHDVVYDFAAGPGMHDHIALRDIAPEELSFEDTALGVRISWSGGDSSVLLVGVSRDELAQDDFMFTDTKVVLPPRGTEEAAAAALRAAEPDADPAHMQFDNVVTHIGGEGADTYSGGAGRDFVFGLAGDDQLSGGEGEDDLRGDAGDDVLDGGGDADHLAGGAGDDTLAGGDMTDDLMGQEGADTISAGAGHDMIEGGAGDDTLDGGDGADAFIVRPDSGDDVIVGGFTAGPGAFDHIAFIDIAPGQVSVENTSGGVLVSWGTGSVLIEGAAKAEMAQDDFMFNDVEGGAFIDDPEITNEGSLLLFSSGGSFSDLFS